jgi:hypothetical protein
MLLGLYHERLNRLSRELMYIIAGILSMGSAHWAAWSHGPPGSLRIFL